MDASKLIDKQIAKFPDWRGKIMNSLRKLIHEADPHIAEEWKWGTGVYTHNKALVCAVGAFKDHVKLNFFKGASLKDKHKLLNSGLESKLSRAVDFHEGDAIKSAPLKDLIREAVAKNK
jgi:hypothetical protein